MKMKRMKRIKRRNSYEKEFLEDRIGGCSIGSRNRPDDALGTARVCCRLNDGGGMVREGLRKNRGNEIEAQ